MGKEHVEDLRKSVRRVHLQRLNTNRELDQSLVSRSADPRQGQHDVVLRSASVKPTPDASSKQENQTEDVHNFPAELHRGRNPNNIEEAKQEVVDCRATVHIGQADTGVLGYQGPTGAPVVLPEGERAGI